MLSRVIEYAVENDMRELRGEYLAAAKNGTVADLYGRMGFSSLDADGRWWWLELDRNSCQTPRTFVHEYRMQ
jgi:predicted enzyme involved in methoxymalonyl-ACP biosynthesis